MNTPCDFQRPACSLACLGRLTLSLLVVWVAGGAACNRTRQVADFTPPPAVFDAAPTLEQLVPVINRTDAITKLQSNSALVQAPTMSDKKLSSTLVLERKRNFRMRGRLSPLPTTLFDLGSNADYFWLQVPEGMQKTLYFAKHEEFARQQQRVMLPVDPTWVIQALGLVHLDPSTVIEGPTRRPDGKLELRTQVVQADGVYRRVLTVDDTTGVVTEQHLYGPDNQLVARAIASDHRYYAEQQCSLPHRVAIHLQPTTGPPLALELEIGDYTINQILVDHPQQFAMPQDASQQVDLVKLGGPLLPRPESSPTASPPGPSTPLELPFAGSPPSQPATPNVTLPEPPPRTANGYVPPTSAAPRLR